MGKYFFTATNFTLLFLSSWPTRTVITLHGTVIGLSEGHSLKLHFQREVSGWKKSPRTKKRKFHIRNSHNFRPGPFARFSTE